MIKTVTFKCQKCGKNHAFEIGTQGLSTLQDAIDKIPEHDADKLLEAVNRMLMNKSEAQRTAFMMNNADSLSMINYDAIAPSINMFDAEDIRKIYSKYTPQQLEKLNASMAIWEEELKCEGFVAFDSIFYCRKCKRLAQGVYLKVRSIENKKEREYVYMQKCAGCGSEMVLVNDANMGYMFDGLIARAPCPDCGGKLVVTDVRFKP